MTFEDDNNSEYIAFIVLAIISGGLTLYPLIKLLILKFKSPTTSFIFYLHLTQFILFITAMPVIYISNINFCSFIGFLRSYSQLSNTFVSLAINILIHRLLSKDNFDMYSSMKKYNRRGFILIFIVPLITVFPFITHKCLELVSS